MKTEFFALVLAAAALASQGDSDYPIRSAELGKVKVTRGFWHDRLETNRVATLTTDFAKCNETPRIANFTNAANRAVGTFGGIPFDDSDVFKVMEGAAYIYAEHPDPALKASNGLTLVPYCVWGNRAPGQDLQCWFRD